MSKSNQFRFLNRVFSCSCFLIISFNVVAGVDYAAEKPAFFKTCRIYEPGFTKCSTESIQKLMDQLLIGVPEINRQVGSLDPMTLDEIIYEQNDNAAATIKATLTNITITGFNNLKIKESRVSKKDFSWQTKIFIPKFRMESHYKMDGRILLLPLTGDGQMFLEIDNLDMVILTKTHLYEKDNFTFYDVQQIRVDFNMTRVRTYFDNLFNGNSKEIERSTNAAFNENWRDFFDALRPIVYETVERIILRLFKSMFDFYPANYFVEDIPTSKKFYGKQT